MTISKLSVGVFVLCKNEQENIGRCLESLRSSNWSVTVLDSGSTDASEAIVSDFEFAALRPYHYVDHCTTYNELTISQAANFHYIIVLDSDMVVSQQLQTEMISLIQAERPSVISAKVLMYIDGLMLRYGSLYPAKPIAFATGETYFISVGHGEMVKPDVKIVQVKAKLGHDDRKPYSQYLQSQARYANSLVKRNASGDISFRDYLRTRTPVLIFIVPVVTYFFRMGFMSGRSGILYALDRLIAEAIMYRQALSKK